MSSSDVEVKQLDLKRGGNKKPVVTKKIRDEHGTPLIPIPKFWLDIGLKLNQEVVIEKRGNNNPLNWEIVIKPRKTEE